MNLDFLKDIRSLFGRKKNEPAEDDDDEFSADETPEAKKKEVDVLSMKDGDHGEIYGIKKEYVKGLTIAVTALICIAFVYNFSNKIGHTDEQNNSIREESTADISSAKRQMSSEALGAINDAVKNGELNKAKNAQKQPEQQGNGTIAPQVQLPQIDVGRQYGNQYTLPSMIQAATAADMSEEDKAAKKLQDSLKSAIAFFNGADGMGSSAAAGSGGLATNMTDGTVAPVEPTLTYTKPSPYILQAGTCIPAVLISSINSDVEGIVYAQVTRDIYDTASGSNLLIPAGSRFTGEYSAGADGGRVAVTFKELILPNGASYSITDSLIAIDNYGYSGLTGKINHHTGSKITSAAIGAGIAAGASAAFGNSNNYNNGYSAGQLAQQGAMASIMNNVSDLFKQQVNQEDTVTVNAGTSFVVFVKRGLVFNVF